MKDQPLFELICAIMAGGERIDTFSRIGREGVLRRSKNKGLFILVMKKKKKETKHRFPSCWL